MRDDSDGLPLVFIDKVRGASRIAAVDRIAQTHGLSAGLALADARARIPALKAVDFDPHADAAFLAHLADAAIAFTPAVTLEDPDGLTLDITGCAHLFDGENGLARRLQAWFRTQGVSACRVAIALTPDMARALARFSPASPIIAHHDGDVRTLPVAALECSSEDARALRRAGLKSIGDVADRPSVLFRSRFSADFMVKLARVLGEEDRRITPQRPPAPFSADYPCAEPISSHEVIERILRDLTERIAVQLRERGKGGRLFEATFFRSDGVLRRVRVETSQPTRDPAIILRLYRTSLESLADPLDPGFGFDLIRLHVRQAEPYHIAQTSLDARDQTSEQLADLIDRLGTMFDRSRITKLHRVDTYLPERAQVSGPVADAKPSSHWRDTRDDPLPARPVFMFGRPQPIETLGESTRSAPGHFLWRRMSHDIIRADGPERIADEWWNSPSGFGTRDYFRVETAEGRRFWIFRSDASAPPAESQHTSKWFLHGVFP